MSLPPPVFFSGKKTRAVGRPAPVLASATLALVLLGGCKNAGDEDEGPSFVPKAVAFEGKTDPRFVGTWTSSDGKAKIDLAKDGAVKMDQQVSAANGTSNSHVDGMWLASGDSLLFKYPDKSGGDTILRYDAKLTGNAMVLVQSGGRIKTTYTRR